MINHVDPLGTFSKYTLTDSTHTIHLTVVYADNRKDKVLWSEVVVCPLDEKVTTTALRKFHEQYPNVQVDFKEWVVPHDGNKSPLTLDDFR